MKPSTKEKIIFAIILLVAIGIIVDLVMYILHGTISF